MSDKVYIGDSVYARVDENDRLVLTTENGFGPSNTIYLEPEVLTSLIEFVKSERENRERDSFAELMKADPDFEEHIRRAQFEVYKEEHDL